MRNRIRVEPVGQFQNVGVGRLDRSCILGQLAVGEVKVGLSPWVVNLHPAMDDSETWQE